MVFKFTIDKVLNKYFPKNQVKKLPQPLQRLLGHHNPPPVGDHWIWLDILVSTFCGLALLEGVFKSHTIFTNHHVPMIIASYGATAILCFNSSQVPLAQPRNILLGHFVSSLIGICIAKLFGLSDQGRSNYWASGALSVGVASVLMSILNCVHPPAGASALLPSIDSEIKRMSWWYLPVQIISSILIICVAMITGNVFRKYPVYWWYPSNASPAVAPDTPLKLEDKTEPRKRAIDYNSSSPSIVINALEVAVPPGLILDETETEWLEMLQLKVSELSTGKLV